MMKIYIATIFLLICATHSVAYADSATVPNNGNHQGANYKRIPANLQAMACSEPDQQAGCKIYLSGFADTVAMIFNMNSDMDGICGDAKDLAYEFIQVVQKNPKAREAETHMLLLGLLIKNHGCEKGKEKLYNGVSAGKLLDICKVGDFGFNLCSEYQAGFVNALFFMSEQTATPILCGDQRIINSVNISNMLNDKLQNNFKLRHDPAVKVMLDDLMISMPCSSK